MRARECESMRECVHAENTENDTCNVETQPLNPKPSTPSILRVRMICTAVPCIIFRQYVCFTRCVGLNVAYIILILRVRMTCTAVPCLIFTNLCVSQRCTPFCMYHSHSKSEKITCKVETHNVRK